MRRSASCAADSERQCTTARSLKAFARASLAPGETHVVRMRIRLADLAYRAVDPHAWRIEPGEHRIWIARSAGDPSAIETSIAL